MRRLLGDLLSSDPRFEVVATASNGRSALSRALELELDLVILDVLMPEMDGLETLAGIRKAKPRLPVIMFSSITGPAAEATIEALIQGASDYVTKPEGLGPEAARAAVRDELVRKIEVLCAPEESACGVAPREEGSGAVDLVAIGSSTGGPTALNVVLSGLKPPLPVPVVVVQHMPPMFTRIFSDSLSRHTGHDVTEAVDGVPLTPGRVLLAPGGRHLTVVRDRRGAVARLNDDPPENASRPSVDVLFRSVSRAYGSSALALVLTGMGQDGFRGCEELRAAGARVVVQDEGTSVVWGMPGFVARAGLADRVLPLDRIAEEVELRIGAVPPRRRGP